MLVYFHKHDFHLFFHSLFVCLFLFQFSIFNQKEQNKKKREKNNEIILNIVDEIGRKNAVDTHSMKYYFHRKVSNKKNLINWLFIFN